MNHSHTLLQDSHWLSLLALPRYPSNSTQQTYDVLFVIKIQHLWIIMRNVLPKISCWRVLQKDIRSEEHCNKKQIFDAMYLYVLRYFYPHPHVILQATPIPTSLNAFFHLFMRNVIIRRMTATFWVVNYQIKVCYLHFRALMNPFHKWLNLYNR